MEFDVFIVEDSQIALKRLKRIISGYDNLEIVGEEINGEKALSKIKEIKPDLLFLDIELGRISGFEIISELDFKPYIIFTTGHKEYAADAFDVDCVDYLLKPVTKDRMDKALKKLNRFVDVKVVDDNKSGNSNKITVKGSSSYKFLDKDKVLYIKSSKSLVFVYTEDKHYVYNSTLSELEKKITSDTFVRIHNRYIVNLNHIREFKKRNTVDYECILDDKENTTLNVGRVYLKDVKRKLGIDES
ncbi:MAG: response regulator transcription factor [Candidatus Mcinerneyibacterium aminivorans]|uniref:Response regulator transcription factor n=1 Tax=Candidatus Mcinerneyibacterium aminivorans TaxID=2703815 RepID=A0A5D0MF33_9BACT|nr:MAG: response regulator transcription factor [Candidatus Mcinerneyibacterium aminivorans]